MGFTELQRPRYPANVITSQYYYSGKFEPHGPFMIWFNDRERCAVPLLEMSGAVLDPGGAIESYTRDEVQLLKEDIVAVDVLSPEARQTVSLLTRTLKVVLYTERFVFHASLPASAEARMGELLDGLKGLFFAITSVQVYPLRPTRVPVFRTSEMVLLNSHKITSYHAG